MRDERVGAVDRVRVVRLTPELARTLADEATAALTGDGRCSLRNMGTSCFASERCALAGAADAIAPMRLAALCAEPHAYAALATDDGGAVHFAGCATAAPARGCAAVPARPFGPHDLLLSHLCVADAYRGAAIGRRLVDAVLAAAPRGADTYLLVARHGLAPDAAPAVREAFGARVARLRATYAHLAFDPVDECRDYLLLRRRRAAAAAAA